MRVSLLGTPLALACALAHPAPLVAQAQAAQPAQPQVAALKPDTARGDSTAVAAAAAPRPDLAALAGFKVSGYAEASYAASTRASGNAIAGRLYDRYAGYTLNALNVAVDRPYAADRLDAGVTAEIVLGQNASVIQSSGLHLGDQGDLTQLYITLNVPTPNGNGFQFKLGKMATLMGLEVIEAPRNPNWSEGSLFTFVENFTAVGASAEYRFNRVVDAQLRVTDGWDAVQPGNAGKSLMGRVGIAPDSLGSVAFVGYVGPERAGSSARRYGGEVLLSRKLTGRVGASVQADYGREQALVPTTAAADGPTRAAAWWGASAWLTVDLAPTVGLALRGDLVDDRDGARSNGFLFPQFAERPGTRHRFGSGTATLNVRSWSHVLVRPELRFDRSSLPVFDAARGQLSAALSIAYLY